MKYALLDDGSRSSAAKGALGLCPVCRQAVRARCGRIRVHHWAHLCGQDCDPWAEPESEWHRAWKDLFPPAWVEAAIGPHRADILTGSGVVIELQHSPISPDVIEEREQFYRRMVWVVNAQRFSERLFITKHREKREVTFRWKNFHPRWLFARKPVFLDLGEARLSQILGGQRFTDPFADLATGELAGPRTLERWSPPRQGDVLPPLKLDPSLTPLPDFLEESSILQILKVYESGWGIGRALSRERFFAKLAGQAADSDSAG